MLCFILDARPLGMSSRMISDSRITSFNFENEVSNPLNARLGLTERMWKQFGTVTVQTTVNSNRFWLQIVLPDLKKLVYIVVQAKHFDVKSQHYWLKYGLDQVSLSAYKKNGAAYVCFFFFLIILKFRPVAFTIVCNFRESSHQIHLSTKIQAISLSTL